VPSQQQQPEPSAVDENDLNSALDTSKQDATKTVVEKQEDVEIPKPVKSTSPATINSSAGGSKTSEVTQIKLSDDQTNLESFVDTNVFGNAENPETASNPETVNEKDPDLELNENADGDDDEDDAYPETFMRDNNRVNEQQHSTNNNNNAHNKFPHEPVNEIDPADTNDDDNRPHVQMVNFEEDPDSNFFTYLCVIMFLSILLYILYHNRQKVLALLLEGRQGSRGSRGRSRDRSRNGSKAAYSKLDLDCNLEEAIMSKKSMSGKSMDIIY
jgi:hypothetical protein